VAEGLSAEEARVVIDFLQRMAEALENLEEGGQEK